jgi:hypothetical protein
MPLIKDTLVWEFIQKSGKVSKFNCKSGLCYARTLCDNRFHLAIKIDLQRQRSGIENCPAIVAIAQVTLHFPRNLRGQSSFKIFADKANGSFTVHAHGVPPDAGKPLNMHAISQNVYLFLIFVNLV